MSKFCTNCGATLDDDAVFCVECGTSVENGPAPDLTSAAADVSAAPAAEEAVTPAPDPAPAPLPREEAPKAEAPRPEAVRPEQVQQSAPPVIPAAPAAPKEAPQRSKEVRTAGYFWLMLLFAIPVVGLIAMLVLGFTAKNKNLRNFARAHLVWVIVALVLCLLLTLTAFILMRINGVEIDWETLRQNLQNLIPLY